MLDILRASFSIFHMTQRAQQDQPPQCVRASAAPASTRVACAARRRMVVLHAHPKIAPLLTARCGLVGWRARGWIGKWRCVGKCFLKIMRWEMIAASSKKREINMARQNVLLLSILWLVGSYSCLVPNKLGTYFYLANYYSYLLVASYYLLVSSS